MDVRRLELSLWQGNKFYGRTFVNLNDFERNGPWSMLRDCPSNEFISLTINGTTALETIADLKGYQQDAKVLKALHSKYRWYRCFEDFRNVGHLTVKLFGANELKLNEKTGTGTGTGVKNEIVNPFCLVELVNAGLRTETAQKTTSPKWNKILTFYVHDITSVLEFTVFHENAANRSVKFLGKVAIPLLTINNGKKEWYSLKDEQLRSPANDDNPQILLEMRLEWNFLRAIGRMFGAKETKLSSTDDEKVNNLKKQDPKQLLKLAANILDFTNHIENLITWQSPLRSLHVYFLWVFFCLYLKLELLPLPFVLLILINRIKRMRKRDDCYGGDGDDDEEANNVENPGTDANDDDSPFNEQQRLDTPIECVIASLAFLSEKLVNLLTFTNPILTLLAIIALMIGSFILQFVSLRVILLILGTIKFIATIFTKTQPPSFALMNFLSRVPDNVEAIQFTQELPELAAVPEPDESQSCSQA